jgi:hypothetical protein
MSHDENGTPSVYEQLALMRRAVTMLTEELTRAGAERDEARAEVERLTDKLRDTDLRCAAALEGRDE